MNLKIGNKFFFCSIVLSIFVFGYTVRLSTIPDLQYFSLFFLLGIVGLLYKNKINIKLLIILAVMIAWAILINVIEGVPANRWLLYLVFNFFPLILLTISFEKVELDKESLKKVIQLFNFFVILIFAVYVIDIITHSAIMKFVSTYFIKYISRWVPSNESLLTSRYASYLGHFLYTNQIYLTFYAINSCYNKHLNEKILPNYLINILSIIGVASTGSKTGLGIILIWLIIFNIKKIKNVIALIVGVLMLNFIGAFNIIIERISTEKISSGRFDAWELILRMDLIDVHLLYGKGDDLFLYLDKFVDFGTVGIAQEIPILIFFVKYGVFVTLGLIFFLLLLPSLKLCKTKSFDCFAVVGLMFLDINSYNGLLVIPDAQILYELMIVILLLIGNLKQQLDMQDKDKGAGSNGKIS